MMGAATPKFQKIAFRKGGEKGIELLKQKKGGVEEDHSSKEEYCILHIEQGGEIRASPFERIVCPSRPRC